MPAIVIETIAFVAIAALAFQVSFNRQSRREQEPAPRIQDTIQFESNEAVYHVAARGLDTSMPAPQFQANNEVAFVPFNQ